MNRYRDIGFTSRILPLAEFVADRGLDEDACPALADIAVGVDRLQDVVDGDRQFHCVLDALRSGVIGSVTGAEMLVELVQQRIVIPKPDAGRLAHTRACAGTLINPHDNARYSDLSRLRRRVRLDGPSRRPHQRRARLGARGRPQRRRVACKAARSSLQDSPAVPARIRPNRCTGGDSAAAQIPRLGHYSASVGLNKASEEPSVRVGRPILQALQLSRGPILQGLTPRILQGGVAA